MDAVKVQKARHDRLNRMLISDCSHYTKAACQLTFYQYMKDITYHRNDPDLREKHLSSVVQPIKRRTGSPVRLVQPVTRMLKARRRTLQLKAREDAAQLGKLFEEEAKADRDGRSMNPQTSLPMAFLVE